MYTNKTKNWDLPQYQSTDTLNKNDLNTAFKNISDGAGVLSSEIGDLRINDARLEEVVGGVQSQINYSNGIQQTHTSEILSNKTAIGALNQRMAKLQTDYLAHETKLDDVDETLGEQGEQISQLETDTATLTNNYNKLSRIVATATKTTDNTVPLPPTGSILTSVLSRAFKLNSEDINVDNLESVKKVFVEAYVKYYDGDDLVGFANLSTVGLPANFILEGDSSAALSSYTSRGYNKDGMPTDSVIETMSTGMFSVQVDKNSSNSDLRLYTYVAGKSLHEMFPSGSCNVTVNVTFYFMS